MHFASHHRIVITPKGIQNLEQGDMPMQERMMLSHLKKSMTVEGFYELSKKDVLEFNRILNRFYAQGWLEKSEKADENEGVSTASTSPATSPVTATRINEDDLKFQDELEALMNKLKQTQAEMAAISSSEDAADTELTDGQAGQDLVVAPAENLVAIPEPGAEVGGGAKPEAELPAAPAEPEKKKEGIRDDLDFLDDLDLEGIARDRPVDKSQIHKTSVGLSKNEDIFGTGKSEGIKTPFRTIPMPKTAEPVRVQPHKENKENKEKEGRDEEADSSSNRTQSLKLKKELLAMKQRQQKEIEEKIKLLKFRQEQKRKVAQVEAEKKAKDDAMRQRTINMRQAEEAKKKNNPEHLGEMLKKKEEARRKQKAEEAKNKK